MRIEHCGPVDLDGYKAARAQTLSASQLNFVSQLAGGRGRRRRYNENVWERRRKKEMRLLHAEVEFILVCVCVGGWTLFR